MSELKFSLEQNTELMKDIANREKEKKKLQKEAEVRQKHLSLQILYQYGDKTVMILSFQTDRPGQTV